MFGWWCDFVLALSLLTTLPASFCSRVPVAIYLVRPAAVPAFFRWWALLLDLFCAGPTAGCPFCLDQFLGQP